jgi:hypothetical protein
MIVLQGPHSKSRNRIPLPLRPLNPFWNLDPVELRPRPNVSTNSEPIRIIERAARHCPLAGASFCGQPDAAATRRTERQP